MTDRRRQDNVRTLYIVHMSAKEAVEEVAIARNKGRNVFGETARST